MGAVATPDADFSKRSCVRLASHEKKNNSPTTARAPSMDATHSAPFGVNVHGVAFMCTPDNLSPSHW